jgi:hypothetical protein
MNLENIDLVKISDSSYKIYQLINSQRTNLKLEFNEISSPFGLEKFFNVYYINWEIDSTSLITLKQLELEFKDLVLTSNDKYKSWSWSTNIKEKKDFAPLLKTRILEKKKKFCVNSDSSLFEINYKSKLNIEITLDSIWFNDKNKTFGLLWVCQAIKPS